VFTSTIVRSDIVRKTLNVQRFNVQRENAKRKRAPGSPPDALGDPSSIQLMPTQNASFESGVLPDTSIVS
jgi:hypothetical protein